MVESVQVTVPMFAPVVTVEVADVSEITETAPDETPDTPEALKVGALESQDVPEPVHVTVIAVFVSSDDGDTASVAVTNAGL